MLIRILACLIIYFLIFISGVKNAIDVIAEKQLELNKITQEEYNETQTFEYLIKIFKNIINIK